MENPPSDCVTASKVGVGARSYGQNPVVGVQIPYTNTTPRRARMVRLGFIPLGIFSCIATRGEETLCAHTGTADIRPPLFSPLLGPLSR